MKRSFIGFIVLIVLFIAANVHALTTYTMCSSGCTYTNWKDMWDDLPDPLVDHVVVNITPGTYVESGVPESITNDLAGYTLKIQPASNAYPYSTQFDTAKFEADDTDPDWAVYAAGNKGWRYVQIGVTNRSSSCAGLP